MRWDKEKLPEPNLHICGEDDTKIMVYNMKGWPTENGGKKLRAKKIKKHIAKRRILES